MSESAQFWNQVSQIQTPLSLKNRELFIKCENNVENQITH
jgi:hypothetical protein